MCDGVVKLHKLMEEDLLIRFFRDPQTNEFLIAGAGQPHIEAIVSRLKKRYHAEVHLKETKRTKTTDHCHCEITLYLPHQTIIVKESALNMYAAVDIVEAKLKLQLKKYKDLHESGKMHRHLMARLRRRN